MLYDDDTSLKELTNSLFKFQYCFVHPYEPGVFVLHTLLNGVPVFVMVHLLHYLGRNVTLSWWECYIILVGMLHSKYHLLPVILFIIQYYSSSDISCKNSESCRIKYV